MSNVVLVNHIDKIYKEIYPALVKIGKRFPYLGEAREMALDWKSEAAIIAIKFDRAYLDKKVCIRDEGGAIIETVPYDQNLHSPEVLVDSFKVYLRQSYANSLHAKMSKATKDRAHRRKANLEAYSQIDTINYDDSSVSLVSLLKLIKADFQRSQKAQANIVEASFSIFLGALVATTEEVLEDYGNFIVIPNVSAIKNTHYLSRDYLETLEPNIKTKIAQRILVETNPFLIKHLSKMIIGEGQYALPKKIYRYFFEFRGGIRKRIGKYL